MLRLGQTDASKVKNKFLEKFNKLREDADEYVFTSFISDKITTTIYHKECGKTFQGRPYLFIKEDSLTKCPYCYPERKNKISFEKLEKIIYENSNGNLRLLDFETRYREKQRTIDVTLECNICSHVFVRNYQSPTLNFNCPECELRKKETPQK